MRKITEHTYGPHIYMKVELDDGQQEEIDVYIRESGITYKTTADDDPERREQIIDAYKKLY